MARVRHVKLTVGRGPDGLEILALIPASERGSIGLHRGHVIREALHADLDLALYYIDESNRRNGGQLPIARFTSTRSTHQSLEQ